MVFLISYCVKCSHRYSDDQASDHTGHSRDSRSKSHKNASKSRGSRGSNGDENLGSPDHSDEDGGGRSPNRPSDKSKSPKKGGRDDYDSFDEEEARLAEKKKKKAKKKYSDAVSREKYDELYDDYEDLLDENEELSDKVSSLKSQLKQLQQMSKRQTALLQSSVAEKLKVSCQNSSHVTLMAENLDYLLLYSHFAQQREDISAYLLRLCTDYESQLRRCGVNPPQSAAQMFPDLPKASEDDLADAADAAMDQAEDEYFAMKKKIKNLSREREDLLDRIEDLEAVGIACSETPAVSLRPN